MFDRSRYLSDWLLDGVLGLLDESRLPHTVHDRATGENQSVRMQEVVIAGVPYLVTAKRVGGEH